jgi:hypothetical protein
MRVYEYEQKRNLIQLAGIEVYYFFRSLNTNQISPIMITGTIIYQGVTDNLGPIDAAIIVAINQ